MSPDDDRSFILKWSRTFPDIPDREDFTGKLASDPAMFARSRHTPTARVSES